MRSLTLVLLVIGLLLLLAAGVLAFFAIRRWRLHGRLAAPLQRIGKLRGGFAKVKGSVEGGGRPLVAPLTRKECLWYRFRVEEEGRKLLKRGQYTMARGEARVISGRMSQWQWGELLCEVRGDALTLSDGTGVVKVDLQDANILNLEVARLEPSSFQFVISKKLEDYGIETVGEGGAPRKLRFFEEVIQPGDELHLAGPVDEDEDGTALFRSGVLITHGGFKTMAKRHREVALLLTGFVAGLGVLGLGALVAGAVLR